VLRSLSVDGIIDVGANRGQFTLACRVALPRTPVVAFEPIPFEAATFRKIHGKANGIVLIESALGESEGVTKLHLSKSADSSSLLPISRRQVELFPSTSEIALLDVSVKRLDSLSPNWDARNRQLLKLDVQGFELMVLKGATNTLRSCAYVYAECSEVALYDGQALRAEVVSFLEQHGFDQIGRFNCHNVSGQLIQADYLFSRK
jgi:FkbM family methyltransferase